MFAEFQILFKKSKETDIFRIAMSADKNMSRILSHTLVEIPCDGHTGENPVLPTH
jgi:hypothetical protein